MPLTGSGATLGALIKTELEGTGLVVDDTSVLDIATAIGNAVVAHIVAQGLVNAGIPVQVTPATGTGTTTGPGTIG